MLCVKRLWAYLVLLGITEIISNCTIVHAAPITIANPFPLSQTVDRLQQVSITVSSVTGGKAPYTYQWLDTLPGSSTFINATICANPHSLTCFFNTSGSTVIGNYRFKLKVTDKNGAVANSLTANVIINTKLMAGSITPPGASIFQGDGVTLQANPSGGTPPYVYQWYSIKKTPARVPLQESLFLAPYCQRIMQLLSIPFIIAIGLRIAQPRQFTIILGQFW